MRLYWGWQLWQSGWGKLHNLDKVTAFFTNLNLPMPGEMAVFIACVEFFGGIFFAFGAFSRVTSLVLTVNLTMAYFLADREALFSIFSDPDKFMAAAPFTFLFASLLVLIFGLANYRRTGRSDTFSNTEELDNQKVQSPFDVPARATVPWHFDRWDADFPNGGGRNLRIQPKRQTLKKGETCVSDFQL